MVGLTETHSNYKIILDYVKNYKPSPDGNQIDPEMTDLSYNPDSVIKTITQKQKLEQMENIRKSYLDEAMNMQRMVNTIIDFVEGRMSSPELWQEFGLDQEKDTEISARVHELLAEWMEQCKNAGADMAQYMDTMQEMVEKLKNGTLDEEQRKMLLSDEDDLEKDIPEGAEKIFARDGWAHVSDWIGEIPG